MQAFTIIIGVGAAAQLYIRKGSLARAAELAGLALSPPGPVASWLAEGALATLRQVLPADELEAALARGRVLDLQQTVQEILAAADEQAQPYDSSANAPTAGRHLRA